MNGINIKILATKLLTVLGVVTIVVLTVKPSKKPIQRLQEQLSSSYSMDPPITKTETQISDFMNMHKTVPTKRDSKESVPKFDGQESIILWQSGKAPHKVTTQKPISSNEKMKHKRS